MIDIERNAVCTLNSPQFNKCRLHQLSHGSYTYHVFLMTFGLKKQIISLAFSTASAMWRVVIISKLSCLLHVVHLSITGFTGSTNMPWLSTISIWPKGFENFAFCPHFHFGKYPFRPLSTLSFWKISFSAFKSNHH